MEHSSEFVWQIVLVIVNALIAVAGFVGALMINRLIKSIDKLGEADEALHARLTAYREDMLTNYVRHEHLDTVKKDMIGRVDRLELSVTRMLTEQIGGVKELFLALAKVHAEAYKKE